MRLISFVLAVFISFLALQPCADAQVDFISENIVQIENTHSHDPAEQDHCSTFCICVCCGVSVQLITTPVFQKPKEMKLYATRFFGDKSIYESCFSYDIWEPPMI